LILTKIHKFSNCRAALITVVVGFVVFVASLRNPFQGDDYAQIVNNIPVHSLTNVLTFFKGGTFYNGGGVGALTGVYFRPLMTTCFSLVYTIFGPQPIYFHLLQLLLGISSCFILFLLLKHWIEPSVSLFLALLFLVHPINSEIVFSIPVLQDSLYFFFGILGLYMLIAWKSKRMLLVIAISLFLSLLAKETGSLFVVLCVVYLYVWDRKRLLWFIGLMIVPSVVYLTLRVHAIGLLSMNPETAPIDTLNLGGRLLTAPSIVLLYLTKFIFPYKLATNYFWVYPTFSIRHVLLPLIIDILVVSVGIYVALKIKQKASHTQYYAYLFFSIWTTIGLILILQIVPLDSTASEPWFYFSTAGLLGMIGVAISVFPIRANARLLYMLAIILIVAFGFRTSLRGLDWKSSLTLAYNDIAASSDNYAAYDALANHFNNVGNFKEANTYALHSVSMYPSIINYNILGVSYAGTDNYSAAVTAYTSGLKLGSYSVIAENLAILTLVYGNSTNDQQYLNQAITDFPQDGVLWTYVAIFDAEHRENTQAKLAIGNAQRYGLAYQMAYSDIMNSRSFKIKVTGTPTSLTIP
jgi:tetratricopeptide (TPR) repeat protein